MPDVSRSTELVRPTHQHVSRERGMALASQSRNKRDCPFCDPFGRLGRIGDAKYGARGRSGESPFVELPLDNVFPRLTTPLADSPAVALPSNHLQPK